MVKLKIGLIGSGNVASHLAEKLFKSGHCISQVYSRNISNAKKLADRVNAEAIDDLQQLNYQSELLIISVKDDAIQTVLDRLEKTEGLVVHTAGSISMQILNKFSNHGVFYPFQTFTKDVVLKNTVPFCIEANREENLSLLKKVAYSISELVFEMNSEQRKKSHLAAVFACNFSNHMYYIAQQILCENHISFDVIKPLINETANKVMSIMPDEAQTGPASRNDQTIINNHLAELNNEHFKKLYSFVSASIVEQKFKKE